MHLVQGHRHRHRRPRVTFEGDNGTGPNAAWVWSKRGREREAQGRWYEEEAEKFREWGYVLWDEGRLRGWGFGERNWRQGQRRERGRWVCSEEVRRSGRVVPKWDWIPNGERTSRE